ncbi:cellulose binding domain-containing protein [Micromonospora sp. CPCC 206060]|uniref:cellulose binding domain-containing protein n=1 Tax=Micromonospora sp. CPCC 206060 TaxID=3122406 RepID=UPI002FF061C2
MDVPLKRPIPFLAVLAAALVGLATVPTMLAAHATTGRTFATGLTARYVEQSAWDTGYGGGYVIANSGSATAAGWTLEFDLPDGSTISNSWSAVRTSTGQHHRFSNETWNGSITPGGTVDFGFNVYGAGRPMNCLLNGQPCAGGAGPTTPLPSATPTANPTTPPPSATGDQRGQRSDQHRGHALTDITVPS